MELAVRNETSANPRALIVVKSQLVLKCSAPLLTLWSDEISILLCIVCKQLTERVKECVFIIAALPSNTAATTAALKLRGRRGGMLNW